jgi:hypothetical protein
MEKIKFTIFTCGDNMCRIEANDCRSTYRKISDGACICSFDVMLLEMQRISEEVEKLGNIAHFIMA